MKHVVKNLIRLLPMAAAILLSTALGNVIYKYTHSVADQMMFSFGATFCVGTILFTLEEIWLGMIDHFTLFQLMEMVISSYDKQPKPKVQKRNNGTMPKVQK